MGKKYEAPVLETVSLVLDINYCLSGNGTEAVGTRSGELTDDDFE